MVCSLFLDCKATAIDYPPFQRQRKQALDFVSVVLVLAFIIAKLTEAFDGKNIGRVSDKLNPWPFHRSKKSVKFDLRVEALFRSQGLDTSDQIQCKQIGSKRCLLREVLCKLVLLVLINISFLYVLLRAVCSRNRYLIVC